MQAIQVKYDETMLLAAGSYDSSPHKRDSPADIL